MQFNMFEAGAVQTPPKKPLNPSIGYPSNGDLSHGEAPTQLGAFWIYQLSEEFTALLKQNGIEPSPDNLHQLAEFFKGYKAEMMDIKAIAVESGSGAKAVLEDMRKEKTTLIELKNAVVNGASETKQYVATSQQTLDDANSTLSKANQSLETIKQYQSTIEGQQGAIASLLERNTSLESAVKVDLGKIAEERAQINQYKETTVKAKDLVLQTKSTIDGDLSKAIKAVSDAQGTASTLTQKIGIVERDIERVDSLKSTIEGYDRKVSENLEATKKVAQQVTSDKGVIEGYKSEALSAKNSAESIQREASALKGNIEALERSMTAAKSDIATKSSEAAKAAKTASDKAEQVLSLANAVAQNKQAMDNYKQAVDKLKQSVESDVLTVGTLSDQVSREKSEAEGFKNQASTFADKAKGYADEAKQNTANLQWDNIKGKPALGKYATATKIDAADIEGLSAVPSGMVGLFFGKSVPSGWLLCNGAAVSRTTYAKLFEAIGTTYGSGDGRTTFNLPKVDDRFLQPTTNANDVGKKVEAGLPNITGTVKASRMFASDREERRNGYGALSLGIERSNNCYASQAANRENLPYISLDASRTNSIYGRSSIVQPASVKLLACIKY